VLSGTWAMACELRFPVTRAQAESCDLKTWKESLQNESVSMSKFKAQEKLRNFRIAGGGDWESPPVTCNWLTFSFLPPTLPNTSCCFYFAPKTRFGCFKL
jgi:hypothetical protein